MPTHVLNQETGESEWIIPLQHLLFLAKGYIMHPNLTNLCVYGCHAYVKYTEQDIGSCQNKMELHALIGYLIGFIISNIWCVWIPEQQQVVSAHDVIFDESKQYNPADPTPREEDIPVVQWPTSQANPSHHILPPASFGSASSTPQGVPAPTMVENPNNIQERPQLPPTPLSLTLDPSLEQQAELSVQP